MREPAAPAMPGSIGVANLVLIGPMGSGKSSVARELAGKTGRCRKDTDQLVVARAGASVAAIFAAQGEARFRELETAALGSLAARTGLIVATGGGIVLREENRALLQKLGVVVWLTAREEVLFARVSRNRRRPLLHTADPRATLRDLLAQRQALYQACAHLTVDTSDEPHARVADTILTAARDFLAAGPLLSTSRPEPAAP